MTLKEDRFLQRQAEDIEHLVEALVNAINDRLSCDLQSERISELWVDEDTRSDLLRRLGFENIKSASPNIRRRAWYGAKKGCVGVWRLDLSSQHWWVHAVRITPLLRKVRRSRSVEYPRVTNTQYPAVYGK